MAATPVVRHRQQGRPPGGRQRPQPGGEGAGAAVRLPRHRRRDRLGRRGGGRLQAETEERVTRRPGRVQGEAGQAEHLAEVAGRRRAAPSGKTYKIDCKVVQGIESDKAKAISKKIRDEGPKGVQAQIQGDQLRVTGKKRDDLQAVIALLKHEDFGVALQFTNYR